MSRHVYREVVPVLEGRTIDLNGPILHVATRNEDEVEFWHLHDTEQPTTRHNFAVFGTGRALPDSVIIHVGTAITPSGRFVWHLFETQYT